MDSQVSLEWNSSRENRNFDAYSFFMKEDFIISEQGTNTNFKMEKQFLLYERSEELIFATYI